LVNKNILPYFLIVAVSLPLMGIDLHLPSLPMMAEYFHVSSALIKNSISAFQFGLLGSAIIYGPLSDSLGRRPILIFGSGLFMISSILLVFSQHIDSFLILRFIQGCGGGVAAVLVPAILSDNFSEGESSKILAQMAVIILMTPAIAPIMGGYLAAYFGWQACFILLSLCSILAFAAFLVFFPETHMIEARTKLHLSNLLNRFKLVLSNKKFTVYALLHSLPSTGAWCLITIIPFLFIKHMGVKPQELGYYITSLVIFVSATSYYVQRVVIAQGADKIMLTGVILLLMGGVLSIFAAFIAPHSPVITAICVLPFPMGIQFIFPASVSKAMTFSADSKGTGSSTATTMRQLFAVIGSFVAVFLPDSTILPTALFLTFIACCAALCLNLARRF
jgi:DHA1 family bicyclomycin/chloramphenicol resistance-like MFS transporter